MQSREQQRKASKGSVQIKTSNNRLQLVFSFGGKRHYLSTGFTDNPVNRKAAEMKARQIELDLASGNFDPTLEKYKPQSVLSTVTPITPIAPPKPSLAELWEQFIAYKRPQCSPSTMRCQYRTFSSYVDKLPTYDLEKACDIRDHALQTIPLDSCKRFLIRLNACCNWAVQSGLISENPFDGMAAEIKLSKSQQADADEIDPFSAEERDAILEALRTNQFSSKYARVKHSHYYPYTRFMFMTGCRPSEAIALQWKHISEDFRYVHFVQAVVEGESGKVCKKGLKTQEKRRFPCNESLKQMLQAIKPEKCDLEALLFPSPEDQTWINTNNFSKRTWRPVLAGLGIKYRKPYQTRHTFITLALENGLDAKDVARLVGNSPKIIYEHYAGNKRELAVPEF
ncbi:MAG: site-specific integrase [Trichocoleus desertorum ATA4-8-CV12]|jgi:integrase|nr:site-specific integrase [Trichocoleus desertorum ATA4-8-CV12]